MKIVTVLGTRPEIIRLSRVIPALDQNCKHVLVSTGQNYDPRLNDIFFKELKLRKPDIELDCRSESLMGQVSKILIGCEEAFQREKPDGVLILGDTNSALSALVAKRMGIRVFHMEAGNRCFDDRVPEEVNRRVVDHCSDILMPYTERSRANLLQEGIECRRIFVTGNPILEVLEYYQREIDSSAALNRYSVKEKEYFLITLHRAENVDDGDRLLRFVKAFERIHHEYKFQLLCSLHPRTRSKLESFGYSLKDAGVQVLEPLGLFDFVRLEKNAYCVLSDSGTVQEECCLFKVPTVTLRDVTERPETLECGSNILAGSMPEDILRCVQLASTRQDSWLPPTEYLKKQVTPTVLKILLGNNA